LFTALLGTLAAVFLTRAQTPMYRARTLLEIDGLNVDFLNMRQVNPTATTDPLQSPEYNIRTQMMVLESRPVLDRAIQKTGFEKELFDASEKGSSIFGWWKGNASSKGDDWSAHEQAMAVAEGGLKVRAEPNSRVIEIMFNSSDARLASEFANGVAAAFIDVSLERRWQASQDTREWLARQLADVKANLEKSEDALQQYATAPDLALTYISDKDSTAEARLRELQIELLKVESERVARQSRYELAATAPQESLPEVVDDATLKEYQIQLSTLRRQLAELTAIYTAEHPKVAQVQAEMEALEGDLNKKRYEIVARIRNEYAAAVQREKILRASYAAQVQLVSRQAGKVAHYSVLKREAETNRQLYDSMLQRVREAGLASAMRASDIHVVESARPPSNPYTPNLPLNVSFGLLSGMCFGALLVIRRARSYRGIQDPGQMGIELNLPELGVIPAGDTGRSRIRGLLGNSRPESPLELRTWREWRSAMAESFRVTLTSILLGNGTSDLHVIALSSANPGEGKTTVTSNLGIALARLNRRVLLIDGDMRKPRLHSVFQIDNRDGFSDALAGDTDIRPRETDIPNLFVFPSGRREDERLFSTASFRKLLDRMREEFDMILIDTPPLLHMPDARLIGHEADAVILVVAQHTDRDAVALAKQHLAEDGSSLLGTILNNWDPKSSSYGNRHYGDYYKRYYSEEAS
jgi:capsular exopolysaccharide synthesis family protein